MNELPRALFFYAAIAIGLLRENSCFASTDRNAWLKDYTRSSSLILGWTTDFLRLHRAHVAC